MHDGGEFLRYGSSSTSGTLRHWRRRSGAAGRLVSRSQGTGVVKRGRPSAVDLLFPMPEPGPCDGAFDVVMTELAAVDRGETWCGTFRPIASTNDDPIGVKLLDDEIGYGAIVPTTGALRTAEGPGATDLLVLALADSQVIGDF